MLQTVLVFLIFTFTVVSLLRRPIANFWRRVRYSKAEHETMARQAAIERLKNGIIGVHGRDHGGSQNWSHEGDSGCGASCKCGFQPGKAANAFRSLA